jgi:hypothetical protein
MNNNENNHLLDPRRAQERAFGRMIQEDHTAMANLSMTPIHVEYPRKQPNAAIWPYLVVHRTRDEDSDVKNDVNGISPKMKN